MKLVSCTAIVTTLLGLMPFGLAHANESCYPLSIQADEHVRARWPELPEQLRSTFDARDDVDACARVRLVLRRELHVEVTLPDGRAAERVVADVEDVAQVLEALLLVPASSPSRRSSDATNVTPSPPPTVTLPPPAWTFAGESPPGSDRVEPAPTAHGPQRSRPRRVGLELSALAGARVGGPTSLGAGALAFADVTGWLVGIGGRFDRYAMRMQPIRAIEVALLGGRRFRWDDVALDLVTGPALIAIDAGGGDAPHVVAVRPPQVVAPEQRPSTLPRLVLGARLHFRMRSTLRTFVGIDGEVGPAGAPPPGGAGSLPSATIGLALGATVGTR